MTATVDQLVLALRVAGITRTAKLPEDPYTPHGTLNVWANGNEAARYPDDTVYPPTGPNDTWKWGPSFEHEAPTYLSAIDVAERVALTVVARA